MELRIFENKSKRPFSFLLLVYSKKHYTRCVCETQMLPIMANSKDGQGHKNKYLDTCTSRKNLSQENAHVQYESFNIYYLEVMTNVNLKKKID